MLVEHTKEEMVAYKAAWKRENAVPMKKGDRTSKGTACTSSTACESDEYCGDADFIASIQVDECVSCDDVAFSLFTAADFNDLVSGKCGTESSDDDADFSGLLNGLMNSENGDSFFTGDCGPFATKADDKWIDGIDVCVARSADACCDINEGAVAGLAIGLFLALVAAITCCCWCCKCCCFRRKEQPTVVYVNAPQPPSAPQEFASK